MQRANRYLLEGAAAGSAVQAESSRKRLRGLWET